MSPSCIPRARSLAIGAGTILGLGFLVSCAESAAAQAKAISEACGASTNLPSAICECLGERARTDLSKDERAFVLATLRKDAGDVAELRGKLGLEGAMKAGMFMTNAAACAREGAGSTATATPSP